MASTKILSGACKSALIFGAAIGLAASAVAKDNPVIGLGATPSNDAIVLFSGKDTSAWKNPWTVTDGAIVSGHGDTISQREFRDQWAHVEFRVPYMPDKHGQERGNSGVYIQGRYEIQVLDSYGIADPGRGDCGAVYDKAAPLVNACKPPREWQAYDILFRAARFGPDGKKTEDARVTVFQNGIIVQNNTDINGPTGGALDQDESKPGPLRLQDHGTKVEYRNVWVLPLPLSGANHY